MTGSKQSNTASFQQPLLSQSETSQQQPQQYVVVLPQYPPPHRHRLLRKSCQRCLFCLAVFVCIIVAAGYVLWPSDPKLSVVRIRLDRLRFHTGHTISVDATMELTVKVRNEDFYSLYYDSLIVAIGYRGKRLGYVTVNGGHIKAREYAYVNATLQLDRVEILSDVVLLIEDLKNGSVAFDTSSEISGKLGFFSLQLPLKTQIECEVTVNPRDGTISRQSCYPEVSEVQ